MHHKPKIIMIADPNGAGKTTFARAFLPEEARCPTFINADLIAQGLSPFQPEAAALRAGRLMLAEIERQISLHQSFAFETTLSGCFYARRIPAWQAAGFTVKLFFLKLTSEELAIARVRQRVQQGGHAIPEPVIRRRFHKGWNNFLKVYQPIVDEWALYDNSGPIPQLLDQGCKHEA